MGGWKQYFVRNLWTALRSGTGSYGGSGEAKWQRGVPAHRCCLQVLGCEENIHYVAIFDTLVLVSVAHPECRRTCVG